MRWGRALVGVVLMLTAYSVAGAPTVDAAVVAPGTVNNPLLPAQCGLKVVLVVDSSGSIGTNAPQVTGAVGTFLDQLIGTGSDVGLIDFDTQVNSTIPFTPVTAESRAGVFQTYLNSYSAGGGTNWAMALNSSRLMAATSTGVTGRKTDLVLFITDGRPTYRGGYTPPSGPPIPLTNDGDGSNTSTQERVESANRADEIKTLGTHIFLVGVGSALANPPAGDLQSIRSVTGDQQFPTVTNQFGNADYSLIGNFNQLATALRDLVFSVCSTSVTVTKLVESGGVTQPTNGYSFTGTVTSVGGGNNPFQWQLPAAGGQQTAPNAQTLTTSGAGTATFQWTPGSLAAPLAQSSTFTLQETGLPPGSVFASGTCNVRLPDGTSTTNPYTLGDPITVPRGAMVACYITNRRVATVTIEKQWLNAAAGDQAAINVDFPAGATYPGGSAAGTSTAVGGNQVDTVTTLAVPVGATLNLSEVLTGMGYTSVLLCNGAFVDTVVAGNTVTGSFLVPDVPNVKCGFANNRNQTVLVLDKIWGTGSTPGDTVTITLTPPTGAPSIAQNTVGGVGQAGPLMVTVGDTITLSEAFDVGSPTAYSTNLSCDNANGTLTYTPGALTGTLSIVAADAGTVISCSFANNPLTAQVVLAKALDPVLDPGRFDLSVNGGAAELAQAGNGDSTPPLAVNIGSTVTLSESAAVDTVAANYSSSLACDNGIVPSGGSFVVPPSAAGLTITCTFTNTRLRAQLLIAKRWVGPIDPTQSVIAGAASGQELDGKVFVHDGSVPTPFVLDVVVGETIRLGERFNANDAANYAKDLHCGTVAVPLQGPIAGDPDSPPARLGGALPALDFEANFQIPVAAAGGQVLCTFTNSRNSAQMTLQKSWVDAAAGDSAQLSIDGLIDAAATAHASGLPGTETSATVAAAAIYAGEVVTLGELLGTPSSARYAANLTCTDPAGLAYTALAASGTYTVPAVPADVTCTFTNRRQPPATISKLVATPPIRNIDGTYTIVYDIAVANPGVLALDYTLTDTFAFAAGVQVRTVAVTNIEPGGVAVDSAFNGSTHTSIAAATLPAGATHRFRITVTADASAIRTAALLDCTLDAGETGTGFLNRATVNPTAEACAPIPDQAVLRLVKTVDPTTIVVDPAGTARPRLTYTLTVTNDGPSAATGVVVSDPLPAGFQVVSVTTTAGSCVTAPVVTCQIGTLAANSTATITLVVEVAPTQAAGDHTNTASVSSATSDPAGDTSASSAVVQVQVSGPRPLPPTGQSVDETLLTAALLALTGGVLQTIRRRRHDAV